MYTENCFIFEACFIFEETIFSGREKVSFIASLLIKTVQKVYFYLMIADDKWRMYAIVVKYYRYREAHEYTNRK